MQTFLPYPDFEKTAKCLDYRRLGKQRVEAYQILRILLGVTKNKGWAHHPAVLMWKGYESSLADYSIAMCYEWTLRGYKDNLGLWFIAQRLEMYMNNVPDKVPNWIGSRNFHLSHQSNLIRKFPEHYQKYFPNVPNDIPYYWPTKQK